MARDPFQIQQDQQQSGGWNNSTVGGPSSSSSPTYVGGGGSGGGIASSGPGAGGYTNQQSSPGQVAQQPGSGSQGTGFVNLSRILGLNAGSGAKMGDAVANDAGQSAAKAQGEAAGAYNEFQGQVKSGYSQNPDWSQFANPNNGQFDPGYYAFQPQGQPYADHLGNGNKDPLQPVPDSWQDPNLTQKISQAQKIADGANYTGPSADKFSSLNSYMNAAKDLTTAQAQVQGLSNFDGVQSALQKKYGNSNAEAGLDALFVGSNNGAINNVENKYNSADGNPFTNLSQLMGYYGQQAAGNVSAEQQQAASDKAKAQGIVTDWTDYMNSHRPKYFNVPGGGN